MKQIFPTSSQAGIIFPFSINEELREYAFYLNQAFPVSMYTQTFLHGIADSVPLHWHEELQVTCVLEGELDYSINGNRFRLTDDQLLVINIHHLHSSRTLSQDTRTLCINFRPDIFHPFICDHYIYPRITNNPSFSYSLLRIEPEQRALLEKFSNWKEESLGYFSVYHFLSQICEKLLSESEEASEESNYEELELFHTMLSFVQQHYGEALNVRQIAASGLTNKNRCNALFHKYANASPIKYLNEFRLYTAKNLIIRTDRSISEISQTVGYNQVSYFVEQFRSRYGLSPLKYRRQYGTALKESHEKTE